MNFHACSLIITDFQHLYAMKSIWVLWRPDGWRGGDCDTAFLIFIIGLGPMHWDLTVQSYQNLCASCSMYIVGRLLPGINVHRWCHASVVKLLYKYALQWPMQSPQANRLRLHYTCEVNSQCWLCHRALQSMQRGKHVLLHVLHHILILHDHIEHFLHWPYPWGDLKKSTRKIGWIVKPSKGHPILHPNPPERNQDQWTSRFSIRKK